MKESRKNSGTRNEKCKAVSLYLPLDTYEAVKKGAERENRNVSNYISFLLQGVATPKKGKKAKKAELTA